MKALTLSEKINEIMPTLHYSEVVGAIDTYNNFLNQKFKPELIAELFEGWEYELDYYYNSNVEDELIDIGIGYITIRKNYFETTTLPFPKTLGDFILFCQYAGIELELKHTAQVSYPICFKNLFDGDSQSVVKDRLSIQVAANRAYAQLDYSLPSRKSEAVIKYLELKGENKCLNSEL